MNVKIIGHRGAKVLAPENTLASLTKALEHNVDVIETDIHVTKDNVAVLAHNKDVEAETGERYIVGDHTYAELLESVPSLVTLEEGINHINRAVPFYLEIKPGQPVEPIAEVIQNFYTKGWASDDFLIASFDFKVLKEAKQLLPGIPLVVGEPWSGTRAVYRARLLGTRKLSMSQRWLWKGFITPMQRRGWQLYAYTVNQPRKARIFKSYGIHAIFTDYPNLFE